MKAKLENAESQSKHDQDTIKDLNDKLTSLNSSLKARQEELNKAHAKESEERQKSSESYSAIFKQLNEAKEVNLKLQISNQNLD